MKKEKLPHLWEGLSSEEKLDGMGGGVLESQSREQDPVCVRQMESNLHRR